MKLQDKVAIVTGASSGIGLAIAQSYVAQGAKVLLADVSDVAGQAAAAALGESASYYRCDVSDVAQVEALVAFAVTTYGRLDIMVNNAGIGGLGGVLEATDEGWHKTIGINLNGVFFGCRAAAKAKIGRAHV